VFIPCDYLTVLVGGNGVGKSCILRVLNLFYYTNIKVEKPDFYNSDTSDPISITISYSDLTVYETKFFKSYLKGDTLSIEKVITFDDPKPIQKYYGNRFKNPEFEAFRKASGVNLRKEYNDQEINLKKWMQESDHLYVGRRGRIFITYPDIDYLC